ncbi:MULTISPECIES: phosphoglucosamine mutase [Aneurinibacillus]|uniref:Phosphoglucosamine mutase n=1 Tax=Aneurinibacillus thermoaerophilus TaxID=143495 RepID=A0A1G8F1A3_ANETH|nr:MULTISPECIES: phosphoglucosamine mutase [Aneurinibacillus]AMA74385.1 phosphoglucosamine mutase [Aneurinibacillus sp. XH2]MED0677517.1 phosphoglucosamine mutase [Aneurinibacillus thermoaerophilus]MED0680638.1 phosphoglucosamine mutase [Aneurinibacillus thermoaerophilus]MED0738906.1 phosphoglucosamine mutase [Aneurinibacillus thermoaerophilus]MED0757857.1 phosphoglucosamine mutase [Aneurinibacillus thermoaerophilus]
MGKYFGTDGVRGVANTELTPELAYKLGRCGGYVVIRDSKNVKPKVVVGRDTRISGPMLERALIAGLQSIGAEVIRLGVISTPGVAYLTRALEADAGIMISASHNPVEDNGIKFFGGDGFKLLDEKEAEIEKLLDAEKDELPRPIGGDIGTVLNYKEGAQKYLQYLKTTVQNRFGGLKIVVDCANGAASALAAQLFADMEADVVTLACNPDGLNINDNCGSTHPEALQKAVVEHGAALGLAFDGDADRLIAVDEKGSIVDGDFIMAICGIAWKRRGKLKNNTVVSTVMSNIGFYKALEAAGIQTRQTAVGDRYVMEEMLKGGYNIGGEQSGHIIFLDYNTTGDGLLTALQLLDVVVEAQKPLSELAAETMTQYPQILVNVRVADKTKLNGNAVIKAVIEEVEAELGSNGRVLVRPSGTEPIIRVMAEGPDEDELKEYVQKIADVIEKELV